MPQTNTLGGVACPPRSSVKLDYCRQCERPRLYINGQMINDGCKCLRPDLVVGKSIEIETAKIVDAIGVQYDQ